MTWLQLIAWMAGILFAIAAVGALGIIALFALADREADRQSSEAASKGGKQPPRKKRP